MLTSVVPYFLVELTGELVIGLNKAKLEGNMKNINLKTLVKSNGHQRLQRNMINKPHNLFNINCHENSFGTDFK